MAAITFTGLASGIDSSALIQSILDQKRKAQENPLKTRITELTNTNSAFTDLKSLLDKLNTSAQKFRALNGGVLAKSLTSTDETILTGSAGNGAKPGSYQIDVSARAKNATQSFDDRFAAGTSVINSNINNGDTAANRTVSYTIGTGSEQETVNIVLTNTTTASDFVTSFNASSTKARASLVNVGTSATPSYAVVVNSNNEGTSKGSIAVSVGSGVTDPNGDTLTTDGAFVTDTDSPATDAQFTLTGVTGLITRSSNTVTDVIDGVTLNLQSLGTSTITVAQDASKTTSDVQDFVDAYNEVVNYLAKNNTVQRQEDGGNVTNIFGPLAHTSIDESLLSTLRSAIPLAGTSGRTVNIFADLGITTERDGTLKFDTDKFQTALANDSAGVELITQNLGESLGAVQGKIASYTQFNGIIDQAFNSNSTSITSAQDRINSVEALLAKEEESLVAQFARLESTIGKLNSQQSALASLKI